MTKLNTDDTWVSSTKNSLAEVSVAKTLPLTVSLVSYCEYKAYITAEPPRVMCGVRLGRRLAHNAHWVYRVGCSRLGRASIWRTRSMRTEAWNGLLKKLTLGLWDSGGVVMSA